MNADATTALDAFLAAVAAKRPTPGGGAVAAVCGALAAAIGEMVLNYSIGRKATPGATGCTQPVPASIVASAARVEYNPWHPFGET